MSRSITVRLPSRRRASISAAAASVALLPLAFAARHASATTAVITSSKDNTLYESPTGGVSNGSGPGMFTGLTNTNNHRRALVAFDLAPTIPAGSTINDATLTLNASQVSFGVPVTVELRPVLADWGEGASNSGFPGGQGAPSQPGDATWFHRFYNTSTWTNPGGDFSATATGAAEVASPGSITFATSASMRSQAQQWLDAPANNFGWMLWTAEASLGVAVRFSTREDSAALRPMLTIDYTAPVVGGNSSWKDDADGNWSDPSRWSGNVPDGPGAGATFGPVITAPRTITLDSPRSVGTLAFDSASGYTLAGASTLTLNSATTAIVNVVTGSHSITAPVALSSDTVVTVTPAASALTISALQPAPSRAITKAGAGNLALNRVQAATLTVNAGTVTLAPAAGGASSLALLSVAPSAALDLTDNDLVTGTPKSAVETLVRNGRNGGAWTGTGGITSANARNLATTGLGVLSGAEYNSVGGTGTFSGQTYAAGDTLVKYTWNGDANFDGRVTFDDYVKIDTGFNTHLTGWLNGDFNYSGAVNFDDYVLIDIAFNQQSGTLSRAVDWISGDDRSEAGSGRTATGVSEVIGHLDQFGAAYGQAFLAAVPEPGAMLTCVGVATLPLRRRSRRRVG